MTNLDDIARRFREKQFAQAGTPAEDQDADVDLDALIAARMDSAFENQTAGRDTESDEKGPSVDDQRMVEAPDEDPSRPADALAARKVVAASEERGHSFLDASQRLAEPGESEPPLAQPRDVTRADRVEAGHGWVIPDSRARALGPRIKVGLALSNRFDELQHEAKQQGMSKANLILGAFEAHRDEVRAQAQAGAFRDLGPQGPVRSWQVHWHLVEIEEFDQFVDELQDYFERRSRAAVAAALLEACRRT